MYLSYKQLAAWQLLAAINYLKVALQNHTLIFPVGCAAVAEAGGGRGDGGGQRRGQPVTVYSPG